MEDLYKTLSERTRPEDIAQSVLEKFGQQFTESDSDIIQRAAMYSFKQGTFGYSSMRKHFRGISDASKQLTTCGELFPSLTIDVEKHACQPDMIDSYAGEAGSFIGKSLGNSNLSKDRLNREHRKSLGLDISKRQYNKRFRLLKRLEKKNEKLRGELKKLEFTLIGKSGLATKIPYEEFSKDVFSACFVAYYVARCNLRSEFTISGQQKPYDEIADLLFSKCRQSDTTNWWLIAHVFSDQEVLEKLSDEQKGILIGKWYEILEEISHLLSDVWDRSNINRETMIVRQGNDSSTWNDTANAWNKARSAWIALNHAMGTEEIIEAVCFGKVLRLMAGDVAMWHRSEGGGLEPDTKVWAELPLPWEVFQGNVRCDKNHVKTVCSKHGVDPIEKGWIAPPPPKKISKFRPTPELVHGVTVSHPGLAMVLRKAGFFSGKQKNGCQ